MSKDESGVAALGKKIEQLGKLMQSPESTLPELVSAADECGLLLQFRLVAKDKREESETVAKDKREESETEVEILQELEPLEARDSPIPYEDFIRYVDNLALTDSDGDGVWATRDAKQRYSPEAVVKPSTAASDKPEWATHVVWYSR